MRQALTGETGAKVGTEPIGRQPIVGQAPANNASLADRSMRRFSMFAWGVLAYNVAVILWGALVRATKSGAGCGGHWPLCNGDVLPGTMPAATVIEFTHRIMSGVALVVVVAMFAWAFRAFPAGAGKANPVRKWATWSLVFILTEALIGGALVLLGHVALNESTGRVYSLTTHLINTFLLLASMALTAWWASPKLSGAAVSAGKSAEPHTSPRQTSAAILAIVLVAIAGVITALGDTLFPAHSLREGLSQDFSSTASFLIRLRVIHPTLAIATAFLIAAAAWPEFKARRTIPLRTLSGLLIGLVGAEILAGALTIVLRAPVAMQLVHLLLADSLWICLIFICIRPFAGHVCVMWTEGPARWMKSA